MTILSPRSAAAAIQPFIEKNFMKRTIRCARAGEWNVDAHKIGVGGFAAGGDLVNRVSNEASRRYKRIDVAD